MVVVPANTAIAQYVFDDGGTHVIDHVDLGPGDAGTAIVTNGSTVIANELEILRIPDERDRGLSFSVTDGTLDVNGGFIGPTVVQDARLNLKGGVYAESDTVPQSFITGRGSSELRIADGAQTIELASLFLFFNAVTIEDQSELFMSGGSLTGATAILSHDQSSATITGGNIVGHREAAILQGASQLTVLGGDVQHIDDENTDRSSLYITRENSSLFLLGGEHETSSFFADNLIDATGSSSVRLANVNVRAAFPMRYGQLFHLKDEANITVDSGSILHFTYSRLEETISSIMIEDSARLAVNGGQFRIAFSHSGNMRRAVVDAMGTSQIDVSGGEFTVTSDVEFALPDNDVYLAYAADQSTVFISGGTTRLNSELDEVVPLTMAARDQASIFITGTDFNYPIGDLADLDGILTGTLADGNPFQWRFERDETARIVLVPEPATGWLLLLGAIVLWRSTRR